MLGKGKIGSLLLLGAAAYGVYKYATMSEEEKKDLKEKGRKFFDENLGSLKNIFGQGSSQTAGAGYGQNGSTQG